MKKQLIVSLCMLVSFNTNAFIVFDPSNYGQAVQQFIQIKEQVKTMKETYDNAKQQYDTLKDTYQTARTQLDRLETIKNFNSGHYTWGDFENSMRDLEDIQWSADTWQNTLKEVAGGNSERYKQLLAAYKKDHPMLDDKEFEKGSTKTKLKTYKETSALTSNADTQATTAYNNIHKHHKSIHELAKKIEETDNTKSSIDLNTRLLAENAKLQTEVLKQLTILNKQEALKSANDLRALEEAARYNQLPSKK